MARITEARAVKAIDEHGALLVFPIKGRSEPASLWSVLYPRTEMRWAWDDGADDRVVSLWHLRESLSRSGAVVYSKWFQSRATFFSRQLFVAMLADLRALGDPTRGLDEDAARLLAELSADSPQGTKALRAATDLRGRPNDGAYARATRELFARLLVVGFGEIDEGAFPSLAIGATRALFEDLWDEADALPAAERDARIARFLPAGSALRRQLDRHRKALIR